MNPGTGRLVNKRPLTRARRGNLSRTRASWWPLISSTFFFFFFPGDEGVGGENVSLTLFPAPSPIAPPGLINKATCCGEVSKVGVASLVSVFRLEYKSRAAPLASSRTQTRLGLVTFEQLFFSTRPGGGRLQLFFILFFISLFCFGVGLN